MSSSVGLVIPVMIAVSAFKSGVQHEQALRDGTAVQSPRTYTLPLAILIAVFATAAASLMGVNAIIEMVIESVAGYGALFVGFSGWAVFMKFGKFSKDFSVLFTIICALFALLEISSKFLSKVPGMEDNTTYQMVCLAAFVIMPIACIGEMISVKRSKKAAK